MHFNLTNLAFIAAITTVASAAPAPAKRALPVNPCEGRDTAARKQLFRDNGATVEGTSSIPSIIKCSIRRQHCSTKAAHADISSSRHCYLHPRNVSIQTRFPHLTIKHISNTTSDPAI